MIIEIDKDSWTAPIKENLREKVLDGIESGNLIFFPSLEFSLRDEEKKFLTPDCANPSAKNISFDSQTYVLRGSVCKGNDLVRLQEMMERFAKKARILIDSLFPHYQEALKWGRTSFRPVEVKGRQVSSYRKDDTRLHVDSFAATPVQDQRLLRVFANINPRFPRLWKLGEPFEAVAQYFLPRVSHKPRVNPRLLQKIGITKGLRTPYDHIMLQIHNEMKRDLQYQKTAPQREFSFPSGSTWIVMTDQVSHAALSGQFLLEQTFYLPIKAMKNPECAPLSILERLTGKSLAANS